ncbi:BCL2 modifying factor 2 [Latimeria chalumnae]|uniref:BCL2 modifying factor 2 n=1 Tax=Latimeria chalumnae TaxID=7897 RepID=UPI00313C0CAB
MEERIPEDCPSDPEDECLSDPGVDIDDDDVFHPSDHSFVCSPSPSPCPCLSPLRFFQSRMLPRSPFFHCCSPGFRRTDCEDKETQTTTPDSPTWDIMLPCGISAQPRRLFNGNAGYRLHFPAHFERNPNLQSRVETWMEERLDQSAEVRIGQKLQRIGDQFHKSYMQRNRRIRNHADQPVWLRIFFFFFRFVHLNVEEIRNGPGRR